MHPACSPFPPLVRTLRHTNPVHKHTTYFNTVFPSTPMFSQLPFPYRFPSRNFTTFSLLFHTHDTPQSIHPRRFYHPNTCQPQWPRGLKRRSTGEEGPVIWNWTRARMAAILRTHPSTTPEEWTVIPTYHLWPSQKQTAITWIIAHFVYYRLQTHRRQSLIDYLDFLRRARWKVHHNTRRNCKVGRYLDVL
jgi:hypothetical protein